MASSGVVVLHSKLSIGLVENYRLFRFLGRLQQQQKQQQLEHSDCWLCRMAAASVAHTKAEKVAFAFARPNKWPIVALLNDECDLHANVSQSLLYF